MLSGATAERQAAQYRGRAVVDLVINTHRLASSVEPVDDATVMVEHLRITVDLQPTKRKAVGRDDGVGAERAALDSAAPMTFLDCEAARASVVDGKWCKCFAVVFSRTGGVEVANRFDQRVGRYANLRGQRFER